MPEDIRNVYKCNQEYPLHFAVASNAWNYSLVSNKFLLFLRFLVKFIYFNNKSTSGYRKIYFGGVNAFTKQQYLKVNGMSNLFFGWGSEDDDFRQRTLKKFRKIIKLPPNIGRYYMIEHEKEKPDENR